MVLLSRREESFMLPMGQNKGRGRASPVHRPTNSGNPSPHGPSTRSSRQ